MATISGHYKGPYQAINLSFDGTTQDDSLVPGRPCVLPDCDYSRRLVASGLFVIDPAPAAVPAPAPAPAPPAVSPATQVQASVEAEPSPEKGN